MKVAVAVVGSVPALTQGWATALRKRFNASLSSDVVVWLDDPGHHVVVVVDAPERCAWTTSACLGQRADAAVVELVAAPSAWDYIDSMERGAVGTARWDAPVAEVEAMISVGLAGRVTVPAFARSQLARSWRDPGFELDWMERELIRGLMNGTTVRHIARLIGYSERETYRRLHAVYVRLGVASRSEAVVKASTLHLVD